MLCVARIVHVLADVVPHLFNLLPVLNSLVLEVKNELIGLVMFSISSEKLLVCLRMSSLEFLVSTDDGVADFYFLERIHVKHTQLQNAILLKSLPCPCLERLVIVILSHHFIHLNVLSLYCRASIHDIRLLDLHSLASDVRLSLFDLCCLK